MPSVPNNVKDQLKAHYLGIDPGKSGGMALCNYNGRVIDYTPMIASDYDLVEYLKDLTLNRGIKCVLERVHSMPGEGHVGAFSFGENYGKLQMAIVAAKIPYEKVTPRVWQKGLGIQSKSKAETKPQFKERLRQKSQELFPDLPIWTRPKSLGIQRQICDAVLIAEYARRKYTGIIKE